MMRVALARLRRAHRPAEAAALPGTKVHVGAGAAGSSLAPFTGRLDITRLAPGFLHA